MRTRSWNIRKVANSPFIVFAFLATAFPSFAASPCSQPGVVFCNGFEGNKAEVNSAWGNPAAGQFSVADPGPFNTSNNQVLKLDTEIPANVTRALGAGYDRLYARWYQKFPAGFDWSNSHHDGLFYSSYLGTVSAGYTPDGCSTGTVWAQLEPNRQGNAANQGQFRWYVYHPGKETPWGDVFGSDNSTYEANIPAAITPGQWYCVETKIDLGTPTPTATGANGSLDVWIDGVHYPTNCGSWPRRCGGIWFRTCSSRKIQTVVFMDSPSGKQALGSMISYDDLVVSTQPIGCGTRVPYSQIPLVISTGSLALGTMGVLYSVFPAASGGAKNYTWSVSGGSLPPGLSFAPLSGNIRGTPTQAGTFSFTVRVTDQSNPPQTADKQLSITINPTANLVRLQDAASTAGITAQMRTNKLRLDFPKGAEHGTIRVLNALGQTVWEHGVKQGTVLAESPALLDGLYVGQVRNRKGSTTFRFAVVR